MKKVSCILVAMLMVFCLVACGPSEEEIKSALCKNNGVWSYSYSDSSGNGYYDFYSFKEDGGVSYYCSDDSVSESLYVGSYTIEDGVIKCEWKKDNVKKELNYTYEDGKLSIVDKNAKGNGKYKNGSVDLPTFTIN